MAKSIRSKRERRLRAVKAEKKAIPKFIARQEALGKHASQPLVWH